MTTKQTLKESNGRETAMDRLRSTSQAVTKKMPAKMQRIAYIGCVDLKKKIGQPFILVKLRAKN